MALLTPLFYESKREESEEFRGFITFRKFSGTSFIFFVSFTFWKVFPSHDFVRWYFMVPIGVLAVNILKAMWRSYRQ